LRNLEYCIARQLLLKGVELNPLKRIAFNQK
jgi:hypothetical protein